MKIFLAILAVILSGAVYYFGFYPPTVMKRAAAQAIEQFNQAAATKDRAKVSEALKLLVADGANISLEVHFLSLTSQNRPIVQEFQDRQSFIVFIDNVLYSLSDFEYKAKLDHFAAADDRKSADVTFSAFKYGDGQSLYGGLGVEVRYSGNSTCSAKAAYTDVNTAQLSQLRCETRLRMIPKPGQREKFQNMDSLNDLLKKQ